MRDVVINVSHHLPIPKRELYLTWRWNGCSPVAIYRWRQLEVILFVHTAGFKSCTTTGPLKSTQTAILSDGDMGLICISACWASLWRLHLARYQPLNSSVTKNYSETALSTWRACKVHEPNDHFVTRSKRPIFCYPFCYLPSFKAFLCLRKSSVIGGKKNDIQWA